MGRYMTFALGFVVMNHVLCTQSQPSRGPYKTARKVVKVDILDPTDDEVVLTFPSNASSLDKFPLVAYAQGLLGGDIDILGYAELFDQMASHGFVIAAHKSCNTGCKQRGPSQFTECVGLLPLKPLDEGWDTYFAETLKVIDWAKNSTHVKELKSVNWTTGVG